MSSAHICAAIRTPFGRYRGALTGIRPDDLAAHSIGALLERTPDLDPARIDDVILGNANGAGDDNRDVGEAKMSQVEPGKPNAGTDRGCC